MFKTKSFLKKIFALSAIFALLFLENSLPLPKSAAFLKSLPFLTIFLFIFYSKKPFAFYAAFFSGTLLDFYSPLPLFSFAFLFLGFCFLIKKLQKIFEDFSFWSFFISFFLGFLTFRFLSFLPSKNVYHYFNSFLKDFILALIFSLMVFFIIKLIKKNAATA